MTQASKATPAKTRILQTLTRPTLAGSPRGMRYMELYNEVKRDIGSLHTFEKYLQDLERHHVIDRTPDPEDGRAVLLELVPEKTREYLEMLQAFRDIEEFAEKVRWTYSEETYHVQLGKVVNLIRVAHSLYSRLHDNRVPIDAYISIEEEGPAVSILSKGRLSELFGKEDKLEAILRERHEA